VTWPRLALLLLAAWSLLTCGATMLLGWWALPTSAGIALAAYAYPYARKFYVDGLAEKDEADK